MRIKFQDQISGWNFRINFQDQISVSNFRINFPDQISGSNFRIKFQYQISGSIFRIKFQDQISGGNFRIYFEKLRLSKIFSMKKMSFIKNQDQILSLWKLWQFGCHIYANFQVLVSSLFKNILAKNIII